MDTSSWVHCILLAGAISVLSTVLHVQLVGLVGVAVLAQCAGESSFLMRVTGRLIQRFGSNHRNCNALVC